MEVKIDEINVSDYVCISELSGELGYVVDPEMIRDHLKLIKKDNRHYIFKAIYDHKVVGYIHGYVSIGLMSTPYLEIVGLIVTDTFRNRGIGKMLIDHLENHVSGCELTRVRCNTKLKSTHQWYRDMGCKEAKEQTVFER